MRKIVPVFGDITKSNLGLNDKHLSRALQANLVFHVAASLRLEFTLKPNLILNLIGTRNVIELSKKMKNLNLMIHFSTGFCCPDVEVLDEKIIPCERQPQELIKCSEWMSENMMARIQSLLMGDHKNTYTFTKRLAEILCRDEYDNGFPVCIVRPSIVIPAFQEPLVGWVRKKEIKFMRLILYLVGLIFNREINFIQLRLIPSMVLLD
jgi:fatty acyl-CoA reductase